MCFYVKKWEACVWGEGGGRGILENARPVSLPREEWLCRFPPSLSNFILFYFDSRREGASGFERVQYHVMYTQ